MAFSQNTQKDSSYMQYSMHTFHIRRNFLKILDSAYNFESILKISWIKHLYNEIFFCKKVCEINCFTSDICKGECVRMNFELAVERMCYSTWWFAKAEKYKILVWKQLNFVTLQNMVETLLNCLLTVL